MSLEDDDSNTEALKIFETLANDPSTRKDFLKLYKKIDPKFVSPELEVDEQIGVATADFKKTISSLENRLYERDLSDRLKDTRRSLVETGLASERDLPEIEKLMVEKKIPDHKVAAEYYRMQQQSARPTPSAFTTPQMPLDMKAMGNNPTQYTRDKANRIMSEIIAARNTH